MKLARSIIGVCLLLSTAASTAHAQVVIPPIAPAKPAVQRNPNALIISTGDLNEAVNFARQARFEDANQSFSLFQDDWAAEAPDVRAQSDDIADAVDVAIATLQGVLNASPSPDVYAVAFQALADAIEEANTQLNAIAPPVGTLRIGSTDLGQAVNWANQGNLPKAHDEFDQFRDEWGLVREAVRAQFPQSAQSVDTATNNVVALISNPANPNPAQADYSAALKTLQQAVADTNAQLAQATPAEDSPPPLDDLRPAVDDANAQLGS